MEFVKGKRGFLINFIENVWRFRNKVLSLQTDIGTKIKNREYKIEDSDAIQAPGFFIFYPISKNTLLITINNKKNYGLHVTRRLRQSRS